MNIVDWVIIGWTAVAFVVGYKIGHHIPLIRFWTGLLGGVMAVCLNAVLIFFTVSYVLQQVDAPQLLIAIQESTIGSWIVVIGAWTYALVS